MHARRRHLLNLAIAPTTNHHHRHRHFLTYDLKLVQSSHNPENFVTLRSTLIVSQLAPATHPASVAPRHGVRWFSCWRRRHPTSAGDRPCGAVVARAIQHQLATVAVVARAIQHQLATVPAVAVVARAWPRRVTVSKAHTPARMMTSPVLVTNTRPLKSSWTPPGNQVTLHLVTDKLACLLKKATAATSTAAGAVVFHGLCGRPLGLLLMVTRASRRSRPRGRGRRRNEE
jgi:hypothetical protein